MFFTPNKHFVLQTAMKKRAAKHKTNTLSLTSITALFALWYKQKKPQFQQITLAVFLLLFCPSCAMYYTQTCPPISVHEEQQIEVEGGVSIPSALLPGASVGLSCCLSEKMRAQVYGRLLLNGVTHSQALLGHEFKFKNKSWLTLSGGFAHGRIKSEYSANGPLGGSLTSIKGNYQSLLGKIQFMKSYSSKNNLGNWGISLTSTK